MLEIKNISKHFKGFRLHDINFSVEEGDYFVLLGVSGSGKSLILELIAGLISPDSGSIILDNHDISSWKIKDREVGLVFQDFAVFPHMTVKENIAYPLKTKGWQKYKIDLEVRRLSEIVGISSLLDRMPANLSGGETQRVALARTLALQPRVLLLDEPLSSLDIQLRYGLQSLLRQINRNGQTIIHVTHDHEEAVALATRVTVLNNGTVIQSGLPDEVFRHPCCSFIANFIGVKNFFKASLEKDNFLGQRKARINDKIVFSVLSDAQEGMGSLMIRSEDILITENKNETHAMNYYHGIISEVLPSRLGMEVVVDIGIHISVMVSRLSFENMKLIEGKNVWISCMSSAVKFIRS